MQNHHTSSHIADAWLRGPAERTLIEPWLTEYAGLMTNAYPDEHPNEHPHDPPAPRTLTVIPALDPHPAQAPARALAA